MKILFHCNHTRYSADYNWGTEQITTALLSSSRLVVHYSYKDNQLVAAATLKALQDGIFFLTVSVNINLLKDFIPIGQWNNGLYLDISRKILLTCWTFNLPQSRWNRSKGRLQSPNRQYERDLKNSRVAKAKTTNTSHPNACNTDSYSSNQLQQPCETGPYLHCSKTPEPAKTAALYRTSSFSSEKPASNTGSKTSLPLNNFWPSWVFCMSAAFGPLSKQRKTTWKSLIND